MARIWSKILVKKASENRVDVEFIKKYLGEKFLIEILKAVHGKKDEKYITALFLKEKFSALQDPIFWSYAQTRLKEGGIMLRRWSEDYIDEDTGKVVTIERTQWVYSNI